MKNELNQAFVALILAAMLPLSLMAQSSITEPGASEPHQLYTTTYDNHSGPHRTGTNGTGGEETYNPQDWSQEGGESGTDAGDKDANGSPIGAPWALLAFAAAYAGVRLVKRGKKGVEE